MLKNVRCTSKISYCQLTVLVVFNESKSLVIFRTLLSITINSNSKQIRSTLKEQMENKVQEEKNEYDLKMKETEMVMEQDRQFIEQEKQRRAERAKILLQVTTKNKEVCDYYSV